MIRRTRGAGPKNLRRKSSFSLDHHDEPQAALEPQHPTSAPSNNRKDRNDADAHSSSPSPGPGSAPIGLQSVVDGDLHPSETPIIKIKRSSASNARKSAALRAVSASAASSSNSASKLRSVSTAPSEPSTLDAASSDDTTASSARADASAQPPAPAPDRDPFASRRRRLGESPFSSASCPRANDESVLKPRSSTTDLASLAAHYASAALSGSSPAPDFIALDGTTITRDTRRSALAAHATTHLDSDPDAEADASGDSDGEDQDMMRQWELDQIRRGGALQTTSGLAAHAARAMHEIAREGDGRLPSLPPIPPLAESLVSLTSTLASLDLAHSADSAAHVAALAAEHDRLVAADAAADSDLHDLSLTQSLTRDLRDHIQDVLEWAADLDGDLSAWEQSLAVDFSADNRDRIIARAMAMLDEVRDDLRDPMAVLAPLNAFKCRDPVGYRRALAHEVVPLVIATHVRCDLLGWDPIGRGDAIEQRMWHLPVTMYGLPSAMSAAARGTGGGSGLNPNDPDAGLYRKVVVGYVMPVLEARIKSAGIALALDRAAGARIVDALEEVLYVVDKSDAHFQKLILAALESCEQTLATAQDSQLDLISAVPNLGSLLVRLDKYAITTASLTSPSVSMSAIAAFAPTTRPDQASLPTDMAAHLVRTHAALLQAAAHVLSTGAPTVSVSAHANSARNLVKLVVDSCAGVYLRPRVAPTAAANAASLIAAVGPLVFPAPHPGDVFSTQQTLPATMVARDEPLVASLRAALVALARNEAWPMTSAQVEVVSKWAVDQAGGWAEQTLQLHDVVSGFKGRRTV